MTASERVARYAFFALIATLCNLAAQRFVLALAGNDHALAPAILIGTGTGLVIKYALDKRWIFADRSSGARAHVRLFSAYTLASLLTTAIFWSMEGLFWAVWRTDLMRELGAALGLSIGYVVKYRLDRDLVFSGRPA